MAPTTNAGTIIHDVVSTKLEIPNSAIDAITTNMANNLYSALKKASAPSLIFLDISCILSFPGLCFFTHDIFINIKTKPRMAKIRGIYM